jgi:hypothetical protein
MRRIGGPHGQVLGSGVVPECVLIGRRCDQGTDLLLGWLFLVVRCGRCLRSFHGVVLGNEEASLCGFLMRVAVVVGQIRSLCFTPDGRALLSATQDSLKARSISCVLSHSTSLSLSLSLSLSRLTPDRWWDGSHTACWTRSTLAGSESATCASRASSCWAARLPRAL